MIHVTEASFGDIHHFWSEFPLSVPSAPFMAPRCPLAKRSLSHGALLRQKPFNPSCDRDARISRPGKLELT